MSSENFGAYIQFGYNNVYLATGLIWNSLALVSKVKVFPWINDYR